MYHPGGGYLKNDTCTSVSSCDWKDCKGGANSMLCTRDCTGFWIATKDMAICECIWQL